MRCEDWVELRGWSRWPSTTEITADENADDTTWLCDAGQLGPVLGSPSHRADVLDRSFVLILCACFGWPVFGRVVGAGGKQHV